MEKSVHKRTKKKQRVSRGPIEEEEQEATRALGKEEGEEQKEAN